MASEWRETTVGEQVTLQRGVDITKVVQRAGKVPVISSGGVSSYHDTPAASGPGVVLGRKGVVGSVYYVASDYWPHDTTLWVKDFHGNDPRFVYYFFRWMAPTLARMDVGSANPTLNRNHVHPIEISWPAVAQQRAIARILGTLDDKIELNRRMNETLEAIARALFKSWFVDFAPVRAKSEGRDPGVPPHLADLFPDSFEESELGEIPMGWAPRYVGEIAELLVGGDWGADVPTAKQSVAVRCLRGVDLHSLRVSGRSQAPLRFVAEGSLAKRAPGPCDVIVEGSGECGRSLAFGPAVARVFDEPVVYSNFCKRIRATSPAHAVFVERLLNELVSTGDMKNYVTGTAMPNLDLKGLLVGLQTALPPLSVLIEFARYSDLVRTRFLAPESHTLAELRDTLLPKLISGELRVSVPEPDASSAT